MHGQDADGDEEGPPIAVPIETPGIASRDQPAGDEAGAVYKARAAVKPVPVTLITGYLGSGKSTLVNRILTTQHGFRCAVLMNEFGESADMERALIKEPESGEASPLSNWVQLENGCICCSVKNDMVKALEELLQQRAAFDYILIETTGLANPGPVAAALWTDTELEAGVCLDAVVTVVDARNIQRQLSEAPGEGEAACAAAQQVAFADVIMLNKEDLVSPEQMHAVRAELASINAAAAILPCTLCQVDLQHILNTGIYSGQGRQAEEDSTPCPPTCHDPTHSHSHAHAHAHAANASSHPSDIRAVTLYADGDLVLERVRTWMDGLLWDRGSTCPDLFRVKAVLALEGEERVHVMQAVHDLYDVTPGRRWEAGELRRSKLVFIGRRIATPDLEQGLAACAAQS